DAPRACDGSAGALPPRSTALPGRDTGATLDPHPAPRSHDRSRTLPRARRPIQGGEEAVARHILLHTPIAAQHRPHSGVMALDDVAPCAVAEERRLLRGANDVGEEHGREHAIEFRLLVADAGQERFDCVAERLLIACPT